MLKVSIDLQIIGLLWSFLCFVDIIKVGDIAPVIFANELVLFDSSDQPLQFFASFICQVEMRLFFIKSCGDCGFRKSAVMILFRSVIVYDFYWLKYADIAAVMLKEFMCYVFRLFLYSNMILSSYCLVWARLYRVEISNVI